jgi:hypothetical protein
MGSAAWLHSERGEKFSNRWRSVCASLATAAFGWMLWFGSGSLDLPALPDREIVSQPTAARTPLAQPARVLAGLSDEKLDKATSGTPGKTRAEREERRNARKEAARAKREAARELRASKAQARRDAREAKREGADERHAAAVQARREAAEARRDAREAKHEAARERHAAAVQARLEAAEARRDAARQKHEMAQARREGREPVAIPESSSSGSGAGAMASSAASGSRDAGILRINSRPWAQVFIDGRLVGYTPQRGINLTPGEHAVRLVNPTFAMSKTLHVRIAQGQQVTRSEMLEE